jgi:hypothetical protein
MATIIFIKSASGLKKHRNTPFSEEELVLVNQLKKENDFNSPELVSLHLLDPTPEEVNLFNTIYENHLPEVPSGCSLELVDCCVKAESESINKGSIKYFTVDSSLKKTQKFINWDTSISVAEE